MTRPCDVADREHPARDLNPLEEAAGLQRLIDEFGMTHQQAADAVGRSRPAAFNLLRLLQLAKPVQDMLMAGDIEMGHARAVLPLHRAGAGRVALAGGGQGSVGARDRAHRLAGNSILPAQKIGARPRPRSLRLGTSFRMFSAPR